MVSLVSLISVPMATLLFSGAVTQNPPAADDDKDVVVRVIEAPKTTKLLKSDAIVYTKAGDNDGDKQATATMVVSKGDSTLKVVRINDDIEVTLNGKKLSDDRFKLKGDTLIIFDKEGGKLYEMQMGPEGGLSFGPGGAFGGTTTRPGLRLLQEGPGRFTVGVGGGASQGRIGVMMGALDESLRDHLGIDNEDAFIITGVVDGAPAANAGIRAHDIVVRVNGQSASQDLLRKVVLKSEPGARIRLRIIHKGQPKDVTVTVEKVQGGVTPGPGGGMGRFIIERGDDEDFDFDFDFDVDVDFDTDSDFDVHFDTDQFRNMLRGEFDEKQLKEVITRLRAAQPNVKEFTTQLRTLRPQLKNLPNVFDLQRRINPEEIQKQIQKQMRDAMQNIDVQIDDSTRAQIEAAMKNAMGKIRVHLQQGDAVPQVFELMPAPKADRRIMILPERRTDAPLRYRVATPVPTHDTDAGADRLERLEMRLDRLEKLLDRLADQLDDLTDDLP